MLPSPHSAEGSIHLWRWPPLTIPLRWLACTVALSLLLLTAFEPSAQQPNVTATEPRTAGIFNVSSAARAVTAEFANGRGSLIKEFSLASGTSVKWVVTVPASTPAARLAVTAAWSDPPGPNNIPVTVDPTTVTLVNNINLQVGYVGSVETHPTPGTTASYLPWVLNPDLTIKSAATRGLAATRGVDNRNNVEMVSLSPSTAGRYLIIVSHAGAASTAAASIQLVSVAVSGANSEVARDLTVAKAPGVNQYVLNFAADPGAYFTVQSSTDLVSWTDQGSVLAGTAANAVPVSANTGETRRFWRVRRGQ